MSAVLANSSGLAWRRSTVFFTMPSNRSSFEEAGWPSKASRPVFTNETAGKGACLNGGVEIRGILDVRRPRCPGVAHDGVAVGLKVCKCCSRRARSGRADLGYWGRAARRLQRYRLRRSKPRENALFVKSFADGAGIDRWDGSRPWRFPRCPQCRRAGSRAPSLLIM